MPTHLIFQPTAPGMLDLIHYCVILLQILIITSFSLYRLCYDWCFAFGYIDLHCVFLLGETICPCLCFMQTHTHTHTLLTISRLGYKFMHGPVTHMHACAQAPTQAPPPLPLPPLPMSIAVVGGLAAAAAPPPASASVVGGLAAAAAVGAGGSWWCWRLRQCNIC